MDITGFGSFLKDMPQAKVKVKQAKTTQAKTKQDVCPTCGK